MKKKNIVAGATAAALSVAIALGGALPSYAGEWAYGSKSCHRTTASDQYVFTSGTGTGNITHAQKKTETTVYATYIANNGSTDKTTTKNFYFVNTSAASVAGSGARYSSIYCGG